MLNPVGHFLPKKGRNSFCPLAERKFSKTETENHVSETEIIALIRFVYLAKCAGRECETRDQIQKSVV